MNNSLVGSVIFAKVVINRSVVITAWQSPGSKTVNSVVKWGDGDYSPVCTDKHTNLSPYQWIYTKFKFDMRPAYTHKWVYKEVA